MPNDPRFYIRDKHREILAEVSARDISFLETVCQFKVSVKARDALALMRYGW